MRLYSKEWANRVYNEFCSLNPRAKQRNAILVQRMQLLIVGYTSEELTDTILWILRIPRLTKRIWPLYKHYIKISSVELQGITFNAAADEVCRVIAAGVHAKVWVQDDLFI